MSKLSILNTPIRVGGIQIKNRFLMPPMDTNYDNRDGTLSRKQYAYYTERARGGVGLIVTEAVSVSYPRGLISERQLNFKSPNSTPEFHDLTDSVHGFGCRIIPQLHHGGFMAVPAYNANEQSETVEIPADYTIMSVGQRPVGEELYQALLEKGIPTYKIGDAVEQGNFRSATRAALEIAYRI